MFKLNNDILYLIIEEIQDAHSLFSCLLVNRRWCEVVVPILWEDPWCTGNNLDQSSLYYQFILLLSDNSKEFPNDKIRLPQFSHRPLLFDYLSFCKSINASAINYIISSYSPSGSDQFHLQQEIYRLLLRKCSMLKNLDIRTLQLQIFLFPEATNCLESLCELSCDNSMDSVYFYGIAHICQHIQRLIITSTTIEDNEGLVSLIEVQKNLKYFEWYDNLDVSEMRVHAYFVGDIYKEIYMALKKKADTLIHFITYFIRIQFFTNVLSKVLPELHNLKVLNLDILDHNLKYQLNISRFQHLEVLQTGHITIGTVNCLIKSSGGCLKKILIGDFETNNDNLYDDSLLLIRTVRENCPLIECLSLVFITSDDHFIELEHLLRTCQYLKVLILETVADFDKDETITYEQSELAGEKLLNVLIKSTPINLSVIGIFDEYFSINILREFLENWRGRQALSILTSNNEYENEEFAKLIDKYKEEGVIKKFSDSDVQSIIDNYGIP